MTCCEHNPCPGRPKWFLRRFESRPYRCPQCDQCWVTTYHYDGWGISWQWHPIPAPRLRRGVNS